ncbi:MAG: hypothetical protein R3260_03490 [Pseudomonas sp.]|nr:hypothetical protein [Pseudomonas sp.]
MAKALLIKGGRPGALIRYDKEYADDERFELIEDVEKYLVEVGITKAPAKKTTKKKVARKKAAPKPAEPAAESDLDSLIAGLDSGEENDR